MKDTYRNIVVLGGGESGTGAALLAKTLGYEVFLSDAGTLSPAYKDKLIQHQIPFEEQKHSLDKILAADLIVKSPGIDAKKLPFLAETKKAKIKIVGEIEFAAWHTQAPIVAITGTNGKTTTTLLTYHILHFAGKNVQLGGNVGYSFAELVAKEINKEINPEKLVYVLEVSSFMLDDTIHFKPMVGILTNITPDHLDRYDYKIEKYVESKFRIIKNMDASCYFIYGEDSELISEKLIDVETDAVELPFSIYPDEFDGACGDEESITLQINGIEHTISLQKSPLKGKHNVYNTMAAALAAHCMGVDAQTIEAALPSFENHPHRMQVVGVINGVTFINDSKATNVDSAYYALDAMTAPTVWIAGGVDKGNDYGTIKDVVAKKVKALICLGKDNTKLEQYFKGIVPQIVSVDSMPACIEAAIGLAKPGEVVLLSPCCASFDLFKNYEDRGNQFIKQVNMRLQCLC